MNESTVVVNKHWQICFVLFCFLFVFWFTWRVVPLGFLPWKIRVAFPGESQSAATESRYPKYGACFLLFFFFCFFVFFSVSIIHRTLTRTTGSLTCAQIFMHAIAHGTYGHRKRISTKKLTLGENSLAAPENRTCVSGAQVRCFTN